MPNVFRRAALLAAVLAPPIASAATIADRVPPDALLYVNWQGADPLMPQYNGSRLKAVVDAGHLQQSIQAGIADLIDQAVAKSNNDPDIKAALQRSSDVLAILWHHPTALYVGPVDMTDIKNPMPHAALVVQADADADALLALLQPVIEAAKSPPAQNAPPVEAHKSGPFVVFTVGGFKPEYTALFDGHPGNSIAAASPFADALWQTKSKTPAITVYADTDAILKQIYTADDRAQPDAPEMEGWKRTRDALGLSAAHRILMTAGFDGPNWTQETFIALDPHPPGVFSLVDAPVLDGTPFKLIPKNARAFSVVYLDVGKLVETVRDTGTKIIPNFGTQFDAGLATFTKVSGVNAEHDLFKALGPQWVTYSDQTSPMITVNKLADARAAENSFNAIEALATKALHAQARAGHPQPWSLEDSNVGDLPIHTMTNGTASPSWAFKNGNLYLSSLPRGLAVANGPATPQTSVLDNPDYQAVRKQLGGGAANSVSFADLARTAPASYQQMQGLMAMALMMGVRIPPTLLPPLDAISPSLAPSGEITWMDGAGLHRRAISPFPGSELLSGQQGSLVAVGAVSMSVAILIPSLERARELANRSAGAASLRILSQGANIYSVEHNDQLPDSLGQILVEEKMAPTALLDKSSSTRALPPLTAEQIKAIRNDPHALDALIDAHSDFVYVGAGRKEMTDPRVVIAYDKGMHKQGRNIAFEDGHVDFVTNENINAVFTTSNTVDPNPLLKSLPRTQKPPTHRRRQPQP